MNEAIVVTGYESSGSVLIAKTISHVIGACQSFGDWNGYGFNRPLGQSGMVLHRSMPFRRPRCWYDDPDAFRDALSVYGRLRFVITTRDLTISVASRKRRFGGTDEDYRDDNLRAAGLFQGIMAREDHFLWNYETMCALQAPYFQRLYHWLGVKSDFLPRIEDANLRFLSASGIS